jgi:uncharacterized protein
MRIVLDTNVLVSGLLNPYGAPGRIVNLAATGELSLYFDSRILGEFRAVLLRPEFSFAPDHVDALLEQIRCDGVSVAAGPLLHRLPDHDDEPFLEVAMAAAAEYLVTGNTRHYPARCCGSIQVVSPRNFLEIYRAK